MIDPRSSAPFYVGKGTGHRCFSHVHEARKTVRDWKGDYTKLATIREIEEAGHEVRIDILRHGLTEAEAFHVESVAIDLLGFSDLTNRGVGRGTRERGLMGVGDVNAQYGARPVEFDPEHKVILIRSRRSRKGLTEEALHEATRVWWRVGRRRLGADYAMAISGGVVRAVYTIDRWIEPTDDDIAEPPTGVADTASWDTSTGTWRIGICSLTRRPGCRRGPGTLSNM
ncbi:MAG: LEM-3-like GIY-YIG domain-containing protein [Acidimicrobiia bacterium]